jgi:hypothetical protein
MDSSVSLKDEIWFQRVASTNKYIGASPLVRAFRFFTITFNSQIAAF